MKLINTQKKKVSLRGWGTSCGTVFSGPDRTVACMTSQQPRLPAQDPYRIKKIQQVWLMGSPNPTLTEELLKADDTQEEESAFGVTVIARLFHFGLSLGLQWDRKSGVEW